MKKLNCEKRNEPKYTNITANEVALTDLTDP